MSNHTPKVEPLVRAPARMAKIFEKPIISLNKGQPNPLGLSYLRIDFSSRNKSSLNMTGLSVRDIFGKSVMIPRATALLYQGMINEEKNIVTPPGSTVYLIEAVSPLGVSFRVNKCMGALVRFQNFYPPFFQGDTGQEIQDIDLSYNNCVEIHKDDLDFYKNDWRVYLGTKYKTWEEAGDFFRLMDSNGNTLSSLFY